MLGKLFAAPVRLLNVPAVAVERLGGEMQGGGREEPLLSVPLESLASAIEDAVDGEQNG